MIETLNQIIEDGASRKLVHNHTDDEAFKHHGKVVVNGQELVNFGSCSYLGLENEPALKEAVIDAVNRYGTQFSSSRTYLSLGLYQELEASLRKIFEKPLIVTATTTLGHMAAIPVIVGKEDAVILDMQVHASVQMAVQLLKAQKIPTYVIRHNCLDSLEEKIKVLNNRHKNIWFFADGVYSMYGDQAPFRELEGLLNRYDKFHLYVDDAHGTGWTGPKGCGSVRKNMAHHPKMVLTASLNKSFAAAGGCIIFPNDEMERKVRNCGSTYIFSGPIQPPMLGAACASAKWHLSDDLAPKQAKLEELIAYTNQKLANLGLPQYRVTDSPIFFIPVGAYSLVGDILSNMQQDGFYLQAASFPAVPLQRSGVRFMVNNYIGRKEIDSMLQCLLKNYRSHSTRAGITGTTVAGLFGIQPFDLQADSNKSTDSTPEDQLNQELHRSIKNCDKKEWNRYFSNNGNLDHDNIAVIENIFAKEQLPENRWDFYYLTIKDERGHVVLKTFYSTVITKDDMFSPREVSGRVEAQREKNPYYLTSKSVVSGTPITKGNHLYLDREHPQWKTALKILADRMNKVLLETEATKLMLRDFYGSQDPEFKTVMLELGFTNLQMPNNCVIGSFPWDTTEEYLAGLSQKYRYNVRKEILAYEGNFMVEYEKPRSEKEIRTLYELYEQVFDRSFDLNVFKLPFAFFQAMASTPNYDIIRLYLKQTSEDDGSPIVSDPVGVMFSYKNGRVYNALLVGLDYALVYSHNTYKQMLYQTLLRAKQIGCTSLDLAFTAELEKKKVGARPVETYAYVQATDHYNLNVLESV